MFMFLVLITQPASHSINMANKEMNENDQSNESGKKDDWVIVSLSDYTPEPNMTSQNECDEVNKRNPQGQHWNGMRKKTNNTVFL